jgi:hypothetical protein
MIHRSDFNFRAERRKRTVSMLIIGVIGTMLGSVAVAVYVIAHFVIKYW